MPFLEDFKTAIDNYETDNCRTEIVNFSIIGGGENLTEGETFRFHVKVTNDSHINMRNVKVRVFGKLGSPVDYTQVALAGGTFEDYKDSNTFNLAPTQSHVTGLFWGKAIRPTGGSTDIVTARIESWDASLDYLLNERSGAGEREAKITKVILAN